MTDNLNKQPLSAAWPSNGIESLQRCPLCDSNRRELLHQGLQDRIFFCAPGQWDLYECKDCASAYLDPRPTAATIGLAYASYFTHQRDSGFSSLSPMEKIKRTLANGYRNYCYGTRERPASIIGILATLLMPTQKAIIDTGMRHLPRARAGQRLLDLGCGSSIFLSRAHSAGWQVVGADFDAKAVEAAQSSGFDVRLGGVEVFDPSLEQFDVITMAHVIEHLHRPLDVLKSCYALLKPGGFLWLETPNIASTGHRQYGASWRGLEPPRHLVLFSFASLQEQLTQAGFAAIEVQAYRPMCAEIFRASSAIADERDPYAALPSSLPRAALREAESIARADPGRREFVTLKGWKK